MSETTSNPNLVIQSCFFCDMLEKGDTLYSYGEDDAAICFSPIRDIQFCPKCGSRLLTYRDRINKWRKDHDLPEC